MKCCCQRSAARTTASVRMTHLIYMYDAIKKLNKLLLGEWEIHGRDGGVLEELYRVCDVIEHGICAEIRLCREDEMYECLADILMNGTVRV